MSDETSPLLEHISHQDDPIHDSRALERQCEVQQQKSYMVFVSHFFGRV
jgi:hypothetical protein